MDCELEQRDDGLWHCKANCGRAPYPKTIRQRCGAKPQLPTCPDCGAALVKKKRLPENKWWLRCENCHTFVRECRRCNANRPTLTDLASEHDAVD